MVTDDERREVARRLRGPFDVIGQGRYVSLNGTLFGMQLLANSENELRAGVRRLADLIEPGEPEGVCGECSHFNASERFLPCDAFHGLTIADVSACEDFEPRKFDRAAMLDLADEISSTSCDKIDGELTVDLITIWGWAQAIHEAMGVSGNE